MAAAAVAAMTTTGDCHSDGRHHPGRGTAHWVGWYLSTVMPAGSSGDRPNYVGLVVVLGIEHDVMEIPWPRRISKTMDGTTRIYAMPFTTTDDVATLLSLLRGDALATQKPLGEIVRRARLGHEPIPTQP